VLLHLLDGCPAAKRKLLDAPLDSPPQQQQQQQYRPAGGAPAAAAGGSSGGLLGRCARALSDAARQGESGRLASAVLLRMLVVWLHQFPPAVGALLRQPANLPLLADLVNGQQLRPPPSAPLLHPPSCPPCARRRALPAAPRARPPAVRRRLERLAPEWGRGQAPAKAKGRAAVPQGSSRRAAPQWRASRRCCWACASYTRTATAAAAPAA
jgi:hypothetical protein